MFSFIPTDVFNKKNLAVLGVLAMALLFSTLIEKKYYSKQHFGVFNKLAVKTVEYSNEFGKENVARTINIHSPFYINYYLDKLNSNVDFELYKITEPEDFQRVNKNC